MKITGKYITIIGLLIIFSSFISEACLFASEEAPNPLTLSDSYRLALKRSEDIGMKTELINEAQGHFYLAMSQILPSFSFQMTHFEQDASKQNNGGASGGYGISTRRSTPQKQFVFSQPIFSGFKEIAGVQGAGAEKAQRKFERQRAEELLFMDVVESYYLVIQYRKGLEILNSTHKLLEDRLKELTERVKLGRSRDSELVTALADLNLIEFDIEEASRLEAISRQLLEFYIGRDIKGELADEDFEGEYTDLPEYLTKADGRSDVKAQKEAHTLAEKNVIVAQSGFFPSVKLDGNYYTQRVAPQSGNDWDLLFTVDVPIFDGAQTIGDVKVAASQRESARLDFEKTRRLARLDIKDAYENFKYAQKEERTLKNAAEASKKSYELQSEEYRLNLVNNLDVLDALRQYQVVARTLNLAHYQMKRNFWNLKVAVGETILSNEKDMVQR